MPENSLFPFLPLQVFISSTIIDLSEYREQAVDAVIRAGMFPRAMEHDSASTIDALAYSLKLADSADIYVGIIAHRYGEVVDGYNASITELEYQRAIVRGIPTLIFIIEDEYPFSPARMEKDMLKVELLKQFKAELRTKHIVKVFNSPRDLGYLVYEALINCQLGSVSSTAQNQSDVLPYVPSDSLKVAGRLTRNDRALFESLLTGPDIIQSQIMLRTIMRQLPLAIQEEVNPRSGNDFLRPLELIEVCESYPGGLSYLVEAMSQYWEMHGPNLADALASGRLRQAKVLVQRITTSGPVVSQYKDLLALASIIASIDISESNLRNTYDACVPLDVINSGVWSLPISTNRAELLYTIMERLVNAPSTRDKIPPILAFAVRLAQLQTSDGASLLNRWVDKTAEAWGEDTSSLASFQDALHDNGIGLQDNLSVQVSEAVPSLLVKLQPSDGIESHSLFVSMWLQYANTCTCMLLSTEPRPITEIGPLLLDVLNDIGREASVPASAKTRLRIEFFLPRNLLFYDLDALVFDDTVRLGVMYLVILRSLERLAYYVYRPLWTVKWDLLMNGIENMSGDHVFWIRNEKDLNGSDIYPHLIQDGVVGVGFTCPPSILDVNKTDHVFHMAVQAGIPVLLWPRQLPQTASKAKTCKQLLTSLLARANIADLPHELLTRRREAAKGTHDFQLGNHLSLMWEDPLRVPPDDVRLVQPSIRR